jgi:hypothetical protein
MLVEDMSRKKCLFQFQISHVLRFISICDLFTDCPSYIYVLQCSELTQFRVTIAINCPEWTGSLNEGYRVDQAQWSRLLSQCIVSILWALTEFHADVLSVVYYIKEMAYNWLFLRVIRGGLLQTSALTRHSITRRSGKLYGENKRS